MLASATMTVDPPDDIDTLDDLTEYLDALGSEVERIDNLVIKALDRTKDTADDDALQDLARRVDRLEDDLDLVNSTMPDQQKGKLEKVRAIIEFGLTDATGGRAGVKIDTGEAAAASGASRDTARRLMDEIGASFSWAATETPGGPNPKVLKLDLSARDGEAMMDDVRDYFQGGASA